MPRTKPILFSAPMVVALLEGRKTQTRRLFVPPLRDFKLRYAPGDRLWVKETTAIHPGIGWFGYIHGPNPVLIEELKDAGAKIIPSIFMKRKDSRLTLEITGVKVEKLGDISEIDARAEGVWTAEAEAVNAKLECKASHISAFAYLWDKFNADRMDGAAAWECNPWVYALTFRVHKCNVDGMSKELETA